MHRDEDLEELGRWLDEGYASAFRTAYLIVGNRDDAEEAVQEAYLRAWRFRDALPSGVDVRRWLYRVLVNTCYSKLRTEIRHRDRRARGEAADSVREPFDVHDDADRSTDVRRALADLPLHLRVVVVLRYYADLREREIATAIGRAPGTVKSRLHEARRALAEHPAIRPAVLAAPISDTEVRP